MQPAGYGQEKCFDPAARSGGVISFLLLFKQKLYGGTLAAMTPIGTCCKKENAEESQGYKKGDLVGLKAPACQ